MELGRVIGTIWATRKDPNLDGGRMLLVQPIDAARNAVGMPLSAVDTVGAGEGEIVFYTTAYEAVIPWKRRHSGMVMAGLDAAIVGIVDRIDAAGNGR